MPFNLFQCVIETFLHMFPLFDDIVFFRCKFHDDFIKFLARFAIWLPFPQIFLAALFNYFLA